jgi:hypothetical protein
MFVVRSIAIMVPAYRATKSTKLRGTMRAVANGVSYQIDLSDADGRLSNATGDCLRGKENKATLIRKEIEIEVTAYKYSGFSVGVLIAACILL